MIDDLINVADFERVAAEKLDPGVVGYFFGGAEDELTLGENVASPAELGRAHAQRAPAASVFGLDARPSLGEVLGEPHLALEVGEHRLVPPVHRK